MTDTRQLISEYCRRTDGAVTPYMFIKQRVCMYVQVVGRHRQALKPYEKCKAFHAITYKTTLVTARP